MMFWLKRSFRYGLALFFAGGCLGTLPLAAATFTASLDRDTVAVGETATLSLTFEGGQPRNVPAPEVPGLQIASTGNSQNFSIINGQMSSTVTVTFSVTPTRTGEFVIPALTADINGQSLTSQPLKLTVTRPNAPSAAEVNSGSQIAFMKLTLPGKEVYENQIVPARLDVYLRDDVQNLSAFQFTSTPAEGFTVGKMVQSSRQQVQIGNRVYTDIPLSFTLTADRTGPVSVGPFTAGAVIVVPSANPQRDFLGFFGGGEQRQVTLASDSVTAQSLPLPTENRPANFNGAIGNYTLTFTAGPTNVAVGDPVTAHIQISGRGTIETLALPGQADWHDFKAYPPTFHVETSDALGLQGTKIFEQIVTPQSTDVHELPPFSFSFFDPDARAYRTLTQPAIPLAVHSGGTTPAPMVAATRPADNRNPAPQDILPIKDQPGLVTPPGPPLVTRPVFLAAQGLPVLAWLAALVWRKRTDRLANNPRLRRRRQVARLVQDGLNELRRLAAEDKPDDFFATLFRLLQEQLGERLDCPASSITEAVIDERLAGLGAPEKLLAGLRELFQLCNQARYAPLRGSSELAAVIPQFENVLRELQNVNT